MKKIWLILISFCIFTVVTNAQKNIDITSKEAKQIAEKYVACSGFTKHIPSDKSCSKYKKVCDLDDFPCQFLKSEAFGYIPEQQNGENSWVIVFRTRGKLKSKITGTRVRVSNDGTEVKILREKIFLKYVNDRF
ncbi:MAG: hypothetical protein IPJ30_10200 [Acidobacteria bacterium]|nr:hypothetical protein [Acidobacteriota bacterium]